MELFFVLFLCKELAVYYTEFLSLVGGGVSYEFNGLDWRNYLCLMISYGNSDIVIQ